MKKTITFLKTFLVAAGLLVGSSAWGADKEVTLNCTNSITIVGTGVYGTDGSAYSNLIRLNSYKENGGAGAVAFTLDGDWDASKVKSAKLQLYVVSKPNKNRTGSINIKSLDGYPNLSANANTSYSDGKHVVYCETSSSSKRYTFSGTTQATVSGSAYTSSAPAQGAYFDVDVTTYMQGLNTKSVGDMVYFGIDISDWAFDTQLGAYGHTSAPKLVVTYSSETLYTASFTANSGAITPEVTIYSDEAKESPVTNGTLTNGTTYYYRAVLAGYDNYEGSFKVDGSDPSLSFTMAAKPRYTFKVNAVNSVGGAVLKTIYEDVDSYEGKTHSVVYPKYLTGANNIVTYSKDDNTYGESKTALAENETYTVSYTAYDGVAYFVEVEDVITATTYSSWNCSNGSAVRGFTTAKSVFTIPATGNYDITYGICNNNVNYDLYCILSKNDSEISTSDNLKSVSINYIKTTGIVTNNNVSLASGDVLKLTPSSTNGIVDYMLIELKSVPATIGAKGYTTFASPYALDLSSLPDGLTAYYVESENINKANNYVKLTKVTEAVAAGTGLLLEGTANKSYDFTVVASGTDLSATNKMIGCPTATNITKDTENYENFYVMVNGETEPEFQNLKNYLDNNEKVTIPAGKAYLDATGVDAARLSIVFDDNETTGISDVRSKTEDVRGFYDLQGRRVAQPTKGLYIVSGKKVIVK